MPTARRTSIQGTNLLSAAVVVAMVGLSMIAIPVTPANAAASICGSETALWLGTTNADWNTANNWSPAAVPDSTSKVCVPADTPNDPVITGAGPNGEVDQIEVALGGTLGVNGKGFIIGNDSSIATFTISGNGVDVENNGDLTVDTAFNMTQGNVHGSGSITTVIGANFTTGGTKTIANSFTNQGILTWNDGNLDFTGQTVTNSGQWRIPGTTDNLTATTFNNSGGSVTKTNAGTTTITANVSNAGQIIVGTGTMNVPQANSFTNTAGSLSVSSSGVFNHGSGTMALNGGYFHTTTSGVVNTATINVGGGQLTGQGGTYNANVNVSSGFLQPGTYLQGGIGTLNINGDLVQTGGQFKLDLGGTTAGTNYDVVAVTGSASTSGSTMRVDTNGYGPPGGQTYNVMTHAGSISGTYTISEDLTGDPNGYYTPDYGTSPLTIVAHYPGDISGYAFVDNNANGVRDGGDFVGLPGVTVYLDNDNSGTLNGGDNSDVTDADGLYEINNVPPGAKNVRNNNVPSGYARSTTIPLAANIPEGGATNAHIGFYEYIAIEGHVFNDVNLNAVQDGGDTNASGTTIYLDSNNDGDLDGGEPTTTSNGSGDYSFGGLVPGTYYVRASLPAGGIRTTANPPATVVSSGNGATGVNFGIDLVTGSIAGMVYIDVNGNGVKDGPDTGPSAGTTVFFDTNGNGVLNGGERSVNTDNNGDYFFAQVPAGTYDVDVVTPGGFTQTSTELDSVVVATNTDVTGRNVGLFEAPSIGGTVYSDVNSNGSQESNEGGVTNVTVYMDTDNSGTLDIGEDSTTTNALGDYVFADVPGGTYKIRIVAPSPGVQTTTDPLDIIVTTNDGETGVDFGLDVSGSIAGTVYVDTNGNGAKDGGDTVGTVGVQVFLDANGNGTLDGGEMTVLSNVNGEYLFPTVPSQTYDVDIVDPTDTYQTTSELNAVVVGPNQAVITQNVGLFTRTSINGIVYQDTDNDASADSGEPGLGGITVFLDVDNSGTKDGGEPTTTTAADGSFSFAGLDATPQRVRAVLPAGAVRNTANPATINLLSNAPVSGVTFGLDVLGSISGTLYVDVNGNGTKDVADSAGLENLTIYVDANHNNSIDAGEQSAVTSANGNYTLALLGAGTYDIDVVLPNGILQTTPELDSTTVTINQDVASKDLGAHLDGTVTGKVFHDANLDEADNNEFGIRGVTVFVDADNDNAHDDEEAFTVTLEDGSFTIMGIGPGPQKVRVLPWGVAVRTTDNPADIIVDSGATVSNIAFGFDQAVFGSSDPQNQGTGYWMLSDEGEVFEFGSAKNYGSLDELVSPAAGIAPTPTGKGYWVTTAGGGVNAFGDAVYFGSAARLDLNEPVIGIEPTPSGQGYWLLGADGGVFSYGDAKFHGSTGSMKLNAPVKAIASTGDGLGYWLVASDGGVFAFGNAQFKGSMGGKPLNQPVVGITGTSTGDGYLMVASDGGIFNYGAPFYGSAAELELEAPIVGIKSRGDGLGYWLIGRDGGLFAYGQVPYLGNAKKNSEAPIVS
jgi:serine-aspartate repeat-containing protein C/D/E